MDCCGRGYLVLILLCTISFLYFLLIVSVNLIGGVGISFRGFLIQAWDPSATRIGTMKVTDSENQQLLDCSAVDGEISSSVRQF